MTVAAPANPLLTLDALRVLKKAKSIVFFYRQGRSYINCIMDDNNRDKDVEIDCGLEINGGQYPGKYSLGEAIHASHVLSHLQYDEEWRTTLAALKVGDELTIKWRACNNNDYLTRAGLFQDELFLVARRYGKGGTRKKLSFHIATSICENNTAKMVKHTSTPKSVIGDY